MTNFLSSSLRLPKYSNLNSKNYSFGFNGKDKESEFNSGAYDFGARIHDARLGRWMSVDGLFFNYESTGPYCYVNSSPIKFIDPDGNRIVDSNGKTVRVKINKDGGVEFKGRGKLDVETENRIMDLAQTEVGSKLLKVANRRVRKYLIELKDDLAIENLSKLLDSQGGGYDEQRQEGIECGQFTEADYKDKSKYLPICGTNGSKERIKKKDGSGYFTARRIVVNTVSVIAHFDQEAAIKMAQEKEDGLVDLEGNPVSKRTEDNLLNNRITIQDNPCWNIQFTDPSMEVTSTLAHELSEALYPKQSETESRQLEEKFKKEYEAKK